MKRFSERVGVRAAPRQIQLDDMDDSLRASLWNEIVPRLETESGNRWPVAVHLLARDLFKIPTDAVPSNNKGAYNWVRACLVDAVWHEAYDVLEFLGP